MQKQPFESLLEFKSTCLKPTFGNSLGHLKNPMPLGTSFMTESFYTSYNGTSSVLTSNQSWKFVMSKPIKNRSKEIKGQSKSQRWQKQPRIRALWPRRSKPATPVWTEGPSPRIHITKWKRWKMINIEKWCVSKTYTHSTPFYLGQKPPGFWCSVEISKILVGFSEFSQILRWGDALHPHPAKWAWS